MDQYFPWIKIQIHQSRQPTNINPFATWQFLALDYSSQKFHYYHVKSNRWTYHKPQSHLWYICLLIFHAIIHIAKYQNFYDNKPLLCDLQKKPMQESNRSTKSITHGGPSSIDSLTLWTVKKCITGDLGKPSCIFFSQINHINLKGSLSICFWFSTDFISILIILLIWFWPEKTD